MYYTSCDMFPRGEQSCRRSKNSKCPARFSARPLNERHAKNRGQDMCSHVCAAGTNTCVRAAFTLRRSLSILFFSSSRFDSFRQDKKTLRAEYDATYQSIPGMVMIVRSPSIGPLFQHAASARCLVLRMPYLLCLIAPR